MLVIMIMYIIRAIENEDCLNPKIRIDAKILATKITNNVNLFKLNCKLLLQVRLKHAHNKNVNMGPDITFCGFTLRETSMPVRHNINAIAYPSLLNAEELIGVEIKLYSTTGEYRPTNIVRARPVLTNQKRGIFKFSRLVSDLNSMPVDRLDGFVLRLRRKPFFPLFGV
ncbi:hypothetical protein QP150_18750 [Sphingomonas sp. 22L2VL55-3]